jgi:sugar lactone lactonase YvrE
MDSEHGISRRHALAVSAAAGCKKLGRIVHGHPATTNIAFGGDDWKTLFFTSRTHLGAVNVKIAGIPVPVPKK